MFEKIMRIFMSTENQKMFDVYIKYFPTIGKSLKKCKGSRIRVIDNSTGEVEDYNSWVELDQVYKQVNKDDAPVVQEMPKIWTYGHLTRSGEILKYFKNVYKGKVFTTGAFTKPTWVYYIDHNGVFCATSNEMVINLLVNSKEWTKYELPPLKKFTKAQIAEVLKMDASEFEIVG